MNSNKVHNGVNRVQAMWRGYMTRSWIAETRNSYEQIFNSIQQNFDTDTQIEWPHKNLCLPKFRDNHFQRKVEVDKEGTRCSEISNTNSLSQGEEPSRLVPDITNNIDCRDTVRENDKVHTNRKKGHMRDSCSEISRNYNPYTINERDVADSSVQTFYDVESRAEYADMLHSPRRVLPPDKNDDSKTLVDNCSKSRQANTCNFPVKYKSNEPTFNAHQNGNMRVDITNGINDTIDSFEFIETSSEIHHGDKHNILTDSWMSQKSFNASETEFGLETRSKTELLKMKEDLSLELLWIGQAITSRKVYLRMKNCTI